MGDIRLNDDFLVEMLESFIFSEFTEKDYNIYEQQILGIGLSPEDLKQTLDRILESKTQAFKDKIGFLFKINKPNLLDLAFSRAIKRYKTKMTLRFMQFEQNEMGE
ncbi:MAG TPA: hypothetical protein VMV49_16490 [Candidatus Deferrimicrobium sp.]|nr:hypothetical protein [Candidatus Deferrimicrobium sp.]